MDTHLSLLKLGALLGYEPQKEGYCEGATIRWIEAGFLDEEAKFSQRIKQINNKTETLPASIISVRKKLSDKKSISQIEREILDIDAFFDSMEIYTSPWRYKTVLNGHANTGEYERLSYFAASEAINQLGGLTSIHSACGIYTREKIKNDLDELAKIIEQTNTSDEKVGCILNNGFHTIGLRYQPKVGWKFMDINHYDEQDGCTTIPTDKISTLIHQGFTEVLKKKETPFVAFNTSVVTPGNYKDKEQLSLQLEQLANKQKLYKNIARYQESVDLAFVAAANGHTDVLTKLLEEGVNPDVLINDLTPACVAAIKGQANIIALLGRAGVNLNTPDSKGRTPAYAAAQNGYDRVIDVLGTFKADLDKSDNDGITPAYIAAENDNPNVIHTLKKYNTKLDTPNKLGIPPVYIAAQNGNANVIDALGVCKAVLDVVITAANDFTPLHIAVQNGHADVIVALEKHDVDLNAPLASGKTAVHIAAFHGQIDVLNLLKQRHVDFHTQDNNGETPTYSAVVNGKVNVLRLFGPDNKDLNVPNAKGRTPALIAAYFGYEEIIALMKQYYVDLHASDANGVSPLSVAIEKGHEKVVKIIDPIFFITKKIDDFIEQLSTNHKKTSLKTKLDALEALKGLVQSKSSQKTLALLIEEWRLSYPFLTDKIKKKSSSALSAIKEYCSKPFREKSSHLDTIKLFVQTLASQHGEIIFPETEFTAVQQLRSK